ncbi:hypothetical protein [Helicovermis profundi]|uniref:Uncharacterized protein n=1 Tax=Helicovermis profundi TaxID=3065157 RepID=A0AAU9ECN3_9FIRM|nr:hypothetical protein HLPR_20580 [Clostridia bacterium S502]
MKKNNAKIITFIVILSIVFCNNVITFAGNEDIPRIFSVGIQINEDQIKLLE